LGGHDRLGGAAGDSAGGAPEEGTPAASVPRPVKLVDEELGISSDAVLRTCATVLCILISCL
jgi:hypothetical protein